MPTLVCALGGTAVAQKSRRPEAEAAFKQGKDLMTRGEHDAACKKFEASQALEPRASTLMNLAACQEAQKKLVTAWSTFLDAARLAASSDDKIEQALVGPSNDKATKLEPRLSSIEIVVSDAARVPGLVISRDGQIVIDGQWNSKVPIDGGDYTIVARARGTDAWTATIAVASERDEKRVEIPVLKVITPEPPPPDDRVQPPPDDVIVVPPPVDPTPPDAPVPPRETPGGLTGKRKAAIGAAAVGVVAIAGGVVFGMKATSTQADADAICPGTVCNDDEGLRLNDDAQSAAGTANLLWIGGGVAVGAGVALWILGAPRATVGGEDGDDGAVSFTPHVGPDLVGLTVRGGF